MFTEIDYIIEEFDRNQLNFARYYLNIVGFHIKIKVKCYSNLVESKSGIGTGCDISQVVIDMQMGKSVFP